MNSFGSRGFWRSAEKRRGRLSGLLGGVTAGALALAALVCAPTPALAQSGTGGTGAGGSPAAKEPDISKLEKKDLLIFRSGNKVECYILEETESSVRVVVFVGSLRSIASYEKSEILQVKRDEFKPKDDAKKDDQKQDEKKDSGAPKAAPGAIVDLKGNPIPEGTTKVYVAAFRGELGRDVSKTPLTEMVDDIIRIKPEIVIVRFDQSFTQHGEQRYYEWWHDAQQYDMLETARELDTLLSDRISTEPSLTPKPRMVAWIKRALGGAAFLPFTFPEIYFSSDGFHGGLGGLDHLLDGRGDEVVRQKQYSLRLARAEGMAIKGGHDPRIMRAMSYSDYVLSYRTVGGKPEFIDKFPPTAEWTCIKDDGLINETRKDSGEDMIRYKGNDLLTLDAKTAFQIGLSKGTADTLDDLVAEMGLSRNYAFVKNKSDDIFKGWSTDVAKAENEAIKLLRDFRGVEVKQPGGYKERTAARTRSINILRQLDSIVKRYREALNPARLGDPDGMINQIDVVISRIQTAQRLDRPD